MELDDVIIGMVGNEERQFKILFKYHHPERDAEYVFLYDVDHEDEVLLCQYFEDEDRLETVEDEEILDELDEILDAFEAEGILDEE